MSLLFSLKQQLCKINNNRHLLNYVNCVFSSRNYNDIAVEDVPDLSDISIKKSLKNHNINYEDGYTCYIFSCIICKKSTTKQLVTPKLYVNKTTGMYMCSFCMHNGQWNQLEAILSLRNTKKSKIKETMDPTKYLNELEVVLESIKQHTTQLKSYPQEVVEDILAKFKLPVISSFENLQYLDVRINKPKTLLHFPLENVNSTIVGYRTLSSTTKVEETLPHTQYGGLLTWKPLRQTKATAVLVPNLSDFLILANANLHTNIICLPNGTNSLSPYFLPALERYNRLILWLGSDTTSYDAARQFAKKLGEKRCYLIRPNELLPHLKPAQDFKSVLSHAQMMWHKSITTFSSLRADVWSELQNIDKVQGVKWKKYPTLNKIIKGHRRGELTVLTGPTGCGKTTFMSDYSLDLAIQGVNTLWGSFEIRNVRLAKTMLQQMAGFSLEDNIDRFDEVANKFEKLPIYFMMFHGQQPLKVVMEAVEHATYVYDIAHVIIDNVQFMMGMTLEYKSLDKYFQQDALISAFRTFATRKNCHVTLVMHPRKERIEEDLTTSSIFGSAKASQEADNVLIIQDKRLTTMRGKQYLQVAKNRYSGDLGIMTLDFNKESLSYAQKKPKEKKSDSSNVSSVLTSSSQPKETES